MGKLPSGDFKDSDIYQHIEPVFRDDEDIDMVIGHSAGGSATLELEKNYPNRKRTSVTRNAPSFETADPNNILNEDVKPMRFAIAGDPVSMLDMNAQTTYKALDFNSNAITNVVNAYIQPTCKTCY